MSLFDLIDNTRTDKNTVHTYIDIYENLFQSKKETAKNVLEVGILMGGSIKLWDDYFTNAQVYGLDIMPFDQVWNEIKNKESITLYTSTDAYKKEFVESTLASKKFDILIDDGPHTFESIKAFLHLYSPLLAEDGILIIEDIQVPHWIDLLKESTPEHLKPFINVFDLRSKKGRYDDILFVIDRSAR
jgi:cephalosporin hydroxylase